MSKRATRLIQVGLGPMGLAVASRMAAHRHLELLAVVDHDPALAGRALGDLLLEAGMDRPPERPAGLMVRSDLAQTLDVCLADVVVFSTVSSIAQAMDSFLQAIRAGFSVVSSCEELLYPAISHGQEARILDQAARQSGVSILGTGVNPGFVMDYLPLIASGLCPAVSRIEVFRHQDAASRRLPFQRKIGAGLTVEQFNRLVESGKLGHVGLLESAWLLGEGLGWRFDQIKEKTEPVIAADPTRGPDGPIEAGAVSGIRQVFEGYRSGKRKLLLEFIAALGLKAPADRISIHPPPPDGPIELVIPGAVHGDTATAAILSHACACIRSLKPGLRTMADLALLRGHGTDD
ncbi:MAG: hypothetical protein JJU36_13215 [Phycisphaeraceae bacterium]|nr:hypothetical protein [Phycisphaeraceae bacterium]